MGILVQKDEDRSGLTERINADLRERASRNSKQEDVDLVKDSEFLRGTRQTSRSTWFWGTLIALAALSLIVIFCLK